MPQGKPLIFACGVPRINCSGQLAKVSHGLDNSQIKTHSTHDGAFACMSAYLIKIGYTRIGGREFSPPDGGPVRVLTKRTRYGAPLRNGKEGNRHMPCYHRSGIVVG